MISGLSYIRDSPKVYSVMGKMSKVVKIFGNLFTLLNYGIVDALDLNQGCPGSCLMQVANWNSVDVFDHS